MLTDFDGSLPLEYYAEFYAENGWPVLPLLSDKTPACRHGSKDATKDLGQIRKWWKKDPDYGIGIATGNAFGGRLSGLFSLDFDVGHMEGVDGLEALHGWEDDHGSLPETFRMVTGSGGVQLIFHSAGGSWSNVQEGGRTKEAILADPLAGIDVRGQGGYFVAPPSIHPNGNRYSWDIGPGDCPIYEDSGFGPFAELIQAVWKSRHGTRQAKDGGSTGGKFKAVPDRIPKGERNKTLFREACLMRSRNYPATVIREATKLLNAVCCETPLQEREVRNIVKSALKYQPGTSTEKKGGGESWDPEKSMARMKNLLRRS